MIQNATELLNREALTTVEAKEGLRKAIETANQAVEAGLTLESYTEQVASLNKSIETAREAMDAATQFDVLVTYHDSKLTRGGDYSYEKYIGTDEFNAFEDLIANKMLPAVENLQSIAQINEFTIEITAAYNRMVAAVIDMTGASIHTEVDMTSVLQTPSFSEIDEVNLLYTRMDHKRQPICHECQQL